MAPRRSVNPASTARPAGALKDRWVPHDERDHVVDFGHRLAEKTEVPIVNYPQSNGKIERYQRTLDKGTIQAVTPDGARATIAARIDHCNRHSAIGYITPRDKLLGLDTEIWAERDRKLEEAREVRRKRRLHSTRHLNLNPSVRQPTHLSRSR